MADNVLSKSWLFEVVNSQTNTIETSFTLILPPQSYTVREKHRVSITKTFGNAFIDDYGPDNLEITIKGISGTAHVFPTFRTKGPVGSLSDNMPAMDSNFNLELERERAMAVPGLSDLGGEEGYNARGAFYTFRNDIMRYKDLGNFDKKELRVYDLGDEQSYKCALLEFSVDRTSDKPLWYPFTISLFVYARLDNKAATSPRFIQVAKNPLVELERIENTADSATSLFQDVKEFVNQFAKAKAEVAKVRSQFNTYLSQTRQIVESPLTAIKHLVGICTETGGIAADILNAGKITIDRYANSGEMIESMIRSSLAVYGFALTDGSQQDRTEVLEVNNDLDLGDTGDEPEPAAENETYTFNSVAVHMVTGGQTLQDIALEELGDSTLWPYIASLNEINGNDDLQPGDTLYIPVASGSGDIDTTQFIITENRYNDPYGTDIKLDHTGAMVLYESGDTYLITGLDNIMQAVNIRLTTIQGSLIKQSAIGIAAGAGLAGTRLSTNYLRMSIKRTLIEDPRISDVKNIRLVLDGSDIHVSLDIIPSAYNITLPVDVVI